MSGQHAMSGGHINDSSSTQNQNPVPSTLFKSNGELLTTTHVFSPGRVLHAFRFFLIFIYMRSSPLLLFTYNFISILFELVTAEESAVDAEGGGSKHAKYPRLNQPTTGQAAYHFEIG